MNTTAVMFGVIVGCALIFVGAMVGLARLIAWWGLRGWELRRARTQDALGIPKMRPLAEQEP